MRLPAQLSVGEKPACGLDVGRRSLNLGPAGPYSRRGIVEESPEPRVELRQRSIRCRAFRGDIVLACLRRRQRWFEGHHQGS
jgi:hypothetical protein